MRHVSSCAHESHYNFRHKYILFKESSHIHSTLANQDVRSNERKSAFCLFFK